MAEQRFDERFRSICTNIVAPSARGLEWVLWRALWAAIIIRVLFYC